MKLLARHLLLTVLEDNVIVTVSQVVAAARQAAQGAHGIRIQLAAQAVTNAVTRFCPEAGVMLPGLAGALLRAELQQRHRSPADPGGQGVRVLLPLILPEQAHFISVILLIHHLRPELRVRRQVAFSTQVPAAGRTLFVVLHIRGGFPAGQADIGVGGKLKEVAPVFSAEAGAGVVAGEVIVEEDVRPEHVRRPEVTVTIPAAA